ncbi:MAG: RND transporter [Sphingobacteriales bacterium]|nr:MAG: RND transporter [Sphingobacteriales bacterium]
MWQQLAKFVLKNKLVLCLLVLIGTVFMGWQAAQVKLSYEFSKAIPTDNPKYKTFQNFKQQFGEDGNLLVIGFTTDKFFTPTFFSSYTQLCQQLKQVKTVEDVLSVATAVNLVKDSATEKLKAVPLFVGNLNFDSSVTIFKSLPFYKGLLYNESTNTYLTGLRINKDVLASKERTGVVNEILQLANQFQQQHGIIMHYSGLPLIRTQVADRIKLEMNWLLIGSLLLSAIIILIFFKSFSSMLLSLGVVIVSVIWGVGAMHLLGYKISLLNALIPPLIVVIGIPNCIYFLNKYHISFNETGDKQTALVQMISKMGVVTLFCNIAAAIGFAVFALTKSAILQEFGVVAGISIMVIFFISFILIPAVLSYLPQPKSSHTKYLENKWLTAILDKLEWWALNHRKTIYTVTVLLLIVAVAGIFRLKSEGFIVDDLPKSDKIYTDLKFFEHHFKGVMPLEIVVDTKQKNGLRKNTLKIFENIDSLSAYIAKQPEMARPLSVVEGLKFARQAYYDGDSATYGLPNSFDIAFLASYLNAKPDSSSTPNNFSRVLTSFMDKEKQKARISINMADVGSKRLPLLLNSLEQKAQQYFDTANYKIEFTGSSVTFLEGSTFIINGLKESIVWAFALIALCMLYLFRSFKILLCSLIPNLIPLILTAGVMGWAGVPLKPSTVLVFSVALGIAIDITIRFLVNYKQEKTGNEQQMQQLVIDTIHSTGISIIYTSMVLIAGFVIFCFSSFGGTQALGWLTSLTLVVATITNLIFLPALLISITRKKK